MKTKLSILSAALILLAACAAAPTGGGIRISRGPKIPQEFLSIEAFSETSITFKINIRFIQTHLYHIIADEEDRIIAQGWFPTSRDGTGRYTVTLTPNEDFLFQRGARYLLCIGEVHPDELRNRTNTYQCLTNAWFTIFEEGSR